MPRNSILALTLAVILATVAVAQSETAVALDIDIANLVIYRDDVFDATRIATQAGPTTPLPIRTFMNVTWIGDVVAVNGSSAKGTITVRGTYVALSPNPAAGVAVADIGSSLLGDWAFDILREDGSPVGTIVASGWAFGARAAGFSAPGLGNLAVVGGTGAFLGVRGQVKEASATAGPRAVASVVEDPANRRIHGGSGRRYTFQLIPMARPEILQSAEGPAFYHSNFTPVTSSSPAARGEVLIAAVTGLGPTLPGKPSDGLFPDDPQQQVAAPVQVLVNGAAVSASNQVGWPQTTGTYRVDFRIPEDAAAGMAKVQLVAAWIPGPVTEIPVR